MASANPKTVQGGRLKATRNGAQPMLPGLDAPRALAPKPRTRRAKPPRPPKPPKAPRTPKPKLTPIQREALKVADPEAREARGKALHAELKSVKAKLLSSTAFGGKPLAKFWEDVFNTGNAPHGTPIIHKGGLNVLDMIKPL
jgi:hypothetical protein